MSLNLLRDLAAWPSLPRKVLDAGSVQGHVGRSSEECAHVRW